MGSLNVRGSGRWKTPEFAVYYVIIAWFFLREVPYAFTSLSALCDQNRNCVRFLRNSDWLLGRTIDLSDIQWRQLREALPLLSLAAAVHVAIRAVLGRRRRVWPCLVLSLAFVGYVHGSQCLFVVGVCGIAFAITHFSNGARWGPFVTWAFALGLMVWKEYGASRLSFMLLLGPKVGGPLDRLPRAYDWHSSLNLLVLRLVSFSMDSHWARRAAKLEESSLPATSQVSCSSSAESKTSGSIRCNSEGDAPDIPEELPYKLRERQHRPLCEYSLSGCIAHALYAPLWLAGPTISFNAFSSYLHDRPQDTYSAFWIGVYGLRWLFAFGLLEAALHFVPVFALGRSGAYKKLLLGGDAGAEHAAMFVYIVLIVMYVKFLVI